MMITREHLEGLEAARLAPYATFAAKSKGRRHPIAPDPLRTDFMRDRDRVIHSLSFRKLEFKTQVFLPFVGDYHRTRLTHTMEVAQVARTLATALNLNVDLSEAIALGHDLGHTPFGHAGEEAMRECMSGYGGFEHNSQGLRVVELLEERNPAFPGLNLTYEVREGIIKHDTAYDTPDPHPEYAPGKSASLESQVVDLSDEIAYNNADLDDALKLGLATEADLRAVPWVHELFQRTRESLDPSLRDKFVKYRALAKLYDMHVHDALTFSSARIEASGVRTLEDVQNHSGRLVDFSPEFKERLRELKSFMLRRVYFHPRTMMHSNKARKFIRELFQLYMTHTNQLPWKFQEKLEAEGTHRVVCDYIAGMTDRYLMEVYAGSFLPEVMR
jgi:dGTPase